MVSFPVRMHGPRITISPRLITEIVKRLSNPDPHPRQPSSDYIDSKTGISLNRKFLSPHERSLFPEQRRWDGRTVLTDINTRSFLNIAEIELDLFAFYLFQKVHRSFWLDHGMPNWIHTEQVVPILRLHELEFSRQLVDLWLLFVNLCDCVLFQPLLFYQIFLNQLNKRR